MFLVIKNFKVVERLPTMAMVRDFIRKELKESPNAVIDVAKLHKRVYNKRVVTETNELVEESVE